MPPAIIGGAIAAVGAVGAAAIGSKAASKAGKAQAQAADASSQVQRDIYAQNSQTLAPFVQQGAPASYAINSFLGLSPTQQPQQVQPNAAAQFQGGQSYGFEGMDGPQGGYRADIGNIGGGFGSPVNASNGGQPWQSGPMGQVASTQPFVNGRDAFRTFLDNSDYAFQRGEGIDALNSGWAGRGALQSGAAIKGSIQYGKNLDAGYRGEFLNALGNQQAVGLSAGSALAGVGQNYANSLGTINQNRADGIGNAALLKAQNTGQALNSLATIGSNLFGASSAGRTSGGGGYRGGGY